MDDLITRVERFAAFGLWVEQLVAESTGKHGTGIVPIDGEPLGRVAAYGADRIFVGLSLAGSADPSGGLLDSLAAAGPAFAAVTPEDCRGFFLHAGYAT